MQTVSGGVTVLQPAHQHQPQQPARQRQQLVQALLVPQVLQAARVQQQRCKLL